jgi:hypothetical protein
MTSDRLQLLTADDVVQAAVVTRNVLQTPLRYEEPLTCALCFQRVHVEATKSFHLPVRIFRFCDHYEIRRLYTYTHILSDRDSLTEQSCKLHCVNFERITGLHRTWKLC